MPNPVASAAAVYRCLQTDDGDESARVDWQDGEVVVDGNRVTRPGPQDLALVHRAMMALLAVRCGSAA